MKEQNEGQFLKDENKELNQAESPEQLVESAQIENIDTPIIRETEAERTEKIEALKSTIANENSSWSTAAFNQNNRPAEDYDPKVVHIPAPENRKSRVGFWGKLAFSLGLVGMGASAMANDKTAEKELFKNGDAKEKSVSDSADKNPRIEKITPLNVAGQEVAGLKMAGEILIPYSDTTKEVAVLKFEDGKKMVNIQSMIDAIHAKGYEVALPGMMEKMLAENPKLVTLLDKNNQFLVSIIEKTKEADDTKPTEGLTYDQNKKIQELKPEIEAYKTYVPGLHRINKNDDPSTIGADYAVVVYKKVPAQNTANFSDGVVQK